MILDNNLTGISIREDWKIYAMVINTIFISISLESVSQDLYLSKTCRKSNQTQGASHIKHLTCLSLCGSVVPWMKLTFSCPTDKKDLIFPVVLFNVLSCRENHILLIKYPEEN